MRGQPRLSKSRYLAGLQCPRRLWLGWHDPEPKTEAEPGTILAMGTEGFTVKGEVGGCDLVALKDGAPPVVVVGELKLNFSLELVLQAVDRAVACDEVWLAARISAGGNGRERDVRFRSLCRRLGFGMLGVSQRGGWTSSSVLLLHHRDETYDADPDWSRNTGVAVVTLPSAAVRANPS
jgi:hypothetical protein